MDLRQIHMEHVFGPSLGRVWRSSQRSKIKVTRDKNRKTAESCSSNTTADSNRMVRARCK